MTNPNTPFANKLVDLSDDVVLRGLQIALAAIDERLVADDVEDDHGIVEAYEALCAAIAARQVEMASV